MRCHWIFAVGLMALWLVIKIAEMEHFDQDTPGIAERFVQRELALLDAGREGNTVEQYWTGYDDRKETLEMLKQILESEPPTDGIDALLLQVELRLAEVRGEVPEELIGRMIDEDAASLQLRRSLTVNGIYVIAIICFPVFLWFGRKGLLNGGPRWRLTGEWSVPLVLVVFVGAWLTVNLMVIPYFGSLLLTVLPEELIETTWSFLWRGTGPLIAAFFLTGTWTALWRIYGLGDRVDWKALAGGFCFLATFETLRQTVGVTSGAVDPEDFFIVVDPDRWTVMMDVIDGVIFAPVFEELMFRGVLFVGLMRRMGGLTAALVSTTLFALMHTQYAPWEMFSVGVFGLVCCWLTWRTGSIKSGIVLHMIYNGLITWGVYFLYQIPS